MNIFNTQSIDNCILIHKEFDEQKEIVLKGYKAYQRKYNLTNAIISSVLSLCMIVMYCFTSDVYLNPSHVNPEKLDIIMFIIILLIWIINIFVPWFRIKADYKKFEKNLLSAENKRFAFDTDGEYLKMTTLEQLNGIPDQVTGMVQLYLRNDIVHVARTPELYTVVLLNKSFYVIPLNIFSAEEIQQIDGMFLNALGRKYKVLKDKKKV